MVSMSKWTSLVWIGIVALGIDVGQVDGQELHKDWYRFLKGEWTYEIAALNAKGTASWRIAVGGNALVGRFEDEDGTKSIELGGWRPDTKTMVGNGYGSKGNYWLLEFDKITADAIDGVNSGVFPDGRSYQGKFTGKRIDDNHYEWHFKGKVGDEENVEITGKYVRKSQ